VAKLKKKSKSKREKLMAGLVEISPGVMVNSNYKKGKDKALDKVLETLKKDPSSLNKSGFGDRWKI
tara:strand:+ start:198 stop:395 length:198 start_codon:yes stop_codon:yes gene_type:complete